MKKNIISNTMDLNSLFKSDEEYWMYHWLEELKVLGLVESIVYEPESFILFEGSKITTDIQNEKGKIKSITRELLKPTEYTTDFKIKFSSRLYEYLWLEEKNYPKNINIEFISMNDEGYTFIEVKPIFDRNNMTRLVIDKIKWTYQIYGVYVNIIKPPELFKRTFAPKVFFYHRKTGDIRKETKNFKPQQYKRIDTFHFNFSKHESTKRQHSRQTSL